MAALPTPPLAPVDEYLNSSYHPDVEYVDGLLVERGMPTVLHGLFQALLAGYFRMYRKEFRFAVLSETRTQIIERAKYRIPDIMLAPLPLPKDKVMAQAPWVVIEIQSPEDRMPEQWKRFRDYLSIGVPHVILLDPEEAMAFRFGRGSLVETSFTEIDLPTGHMPFDTTALFQQLSDEQNES
jgi:Uma2 family endonuclease